MSADVPAPTSAAPPGPETRPARAALDPLEYHLLARTLAGHRWRMPLVALLAAALSVALIAAVLALDAGVRRLTGSGRLTIDLDDPVSFIASFAIITLLLPATLGAQRLLGPRPLGLLSSVVGRLRWRWLLRALLIALAVQLLVLAVDVTVLSPLTAGPVPAPVLQPGWIVLLGALLVVPVQCAAEEYAFRGVPQQLVGSFLRHPAFAILLPVPFFVFGHGYDVWGQLDVALSAVVAGWITWRTGGLEAAIALHVVNNVSITLLTAIGWADPNTTTGSPVGLAISVVTSAAVLGWLVRSADRHGVARQRGMP